MNTSKRTLVVAYWWNQKSDSWVTFKPPNEKDFLFYYETRMKYSFAWNLFNSSISYRRYRIKTYCGLTLIWKSLSYFCASWKSCALVPLVLVFKSFGFPEIGSGRECRSEKCQGNYGPSWSGILGASVTFNSRFFFTSQPQVPLEITCVREHLNSSLLVL